MIRSFTKCRFALLLIVCVSLFGPIGPLAAQSTLHYIAVGVSRNPNLPAGQQLQFAHKDALDLQRVWQKQKGKLYAVVKGVALTDELATLKNILVALDRTSNEASPGDVVMVALCGHAGGCGVRGEWGFLPYDFEDRDAAGTALTAGVLRARLKDMARRGVTVVLFLDCCHAGAFGLAGGDFVVFAACMPQEYSREHPDWNNGLYTMALVEAMEGKADVNADGLVTIAEIDTYVTNRVAQVLRTNLTSSDLQHPTCGRSTRIRGSLTLARVVTDRRAALSLDGRGSSGTMFNVDRHARN